MSNGVYPPGVHPPGVYPPGVYPPTGPPGPSGEPINCYLQVATLSVDFPAVIWDVKFSFTRNKHEPTSVSVGFDDVVIYTGGLPPATEVAYTFSNDRKFVEDQV